MSSKRGFASMSPERIRAIASLGGKTAHLKGTAHRFTSEEARIAGRKGGAAIARDRERIAALHSQGGTARSQDRVRMAAIGHRGGTTTSQDRTHMATAGRKGGRASASPATV